MSTAPPTEVAASMGLKSRQWPEFSDANTTTSYIFLHSTFSTSWPKTRGRLGSRPASALSCRKAKQRAPRKCGLHKGAFACKSCTRLQTRSTAAPRRSCDKPTAGGQKSFQDLAAMLDLLSLLHSAQHEVRQLLGRLQPSRESRCAARALANKFFTAFSLMTSTSGIAAPPFREKLATGGARLSQNSRVGGGGGGGAHPALLHIR